MPPLADHALAARLRWCYDGRVRMPIARVLLIIGAVGGLTAWVVAQGTVVPAGRRAPAAAPARDAARREAAATRRDSDFDVAVGRLRAGLGLMPAPSASGRNPFRFGARPSQRAALTGAHPAATSAPIESAEAGSAADRPLMHLLGVAADGTGTDPVRTAVIATARQLYLVREGEQIALRFLVVRISEDAVELRDLVSDETFSLPLR